MTSGLKQSWKADERKNEELRLVGGMSHFLSGAYTNRGLVFRMYKEILSIKEERPRTH